MKRILIVEDDDDIRRILRYILEQEGYAVTEAREGEEGLAALRRESADLILLDLRMSGMNGWDFLQVRRGEARMAEIPVIVMTANQSSAPPPDGVALYLTKPVDLDRLIEAIGTLSRRTG